ncbi:MAG: phosphoglucosamine mutase, partial [Pseudomonadota bacterium]
MGRTLFGTDGIRGVAGEYPLNPRTTYAIGAALGGWISKHHLDPEVAIGMDTRESGEAIASSVAAGLARGGVRARFAGVITTPGVAYLARTGHFAAGVMISASHNPYLDNGIKVIDHSGFKLPDEQEHSLERDIFALLERDIHPSAATLHTDESLTRAYIDYLASTFPGSLDRVLVVLDCANGAASRLASDLFERLGARVRAIACSPDGRNINLNCGSLHLSHLRDAVLAFEADLGVAFDGDADRALFVSHSGKIIDGDAVMLLTGLALNAEGRLGEADGKPVVVATVMSNLGLERA